LSEYVDGERIEARYSNGVLTVTIPKSAAAMPRKIAVKSE
jgi:HSP20 family molecular chaperone IbpA